jgi:hypothetical protein
VVSHVEIVLLGTQYPCIINAPRHLINGNVTAMETLPKEFYTLLNLLQHHESKSI